MRRLFWWLLTLSWAVLIFYLTSIPNLTVVEDTLLSLLFTSLAHFFFFGIQAVLLLVSLSSDLRTPIPYALIITSVYGLADELHQLNVPGRSATLGDWVFDTLGAAIFVYLFLKIRAKKV